MKIRGGVEVKDIISEREMWNGLFGTITPDSTTGGADKGSLNDSCL